MVLVIEMTGIGNSIDCGLNFLMGGVRRGASTSRCLALAVQEERAWLDPRHHRPMSLLWKRP